MEEELNGAASLSRTVEPAPTSPKTPELFILNDDDDASPPPAPVVAGRHRLQRQHAVMVHATPCGRPVMPVVTEEPRIGAASRQPPPPPSPEIVVISDDENGNVDETINNLFPTIRRRLDYEMEEDEEGKEEEEEEEVDDDSGMEEGEIVEPEDSDMTDVAENIPVRMNVPSGPLIMAINSLTNKVNEVVYENCIGCINECGGQRDHPECLWLSRNEKIDKYFEAALARLDFKDFFNQFDNVYNVKCMFEEDQDMCVEEASSFYHFDLRKNDIKSHLKAKLKEM
ncbi:uncharacterized protein LOC129264977 isoform X2 [Lytechinus pictus]